MDSHLGKGQDPPSLLLRRANGARMAHIKERKDPLKYSPQTGHQDPYHTFYEEQQRLHREHQEILRGQRDLTRRQEEIQQQLIGMDAYMRSFFGPEGQGYRPPSPEQ